MPQDATRISAWHEDKIGGYYDSEKRWQILHPDFLQDGGGGGVSNLFTSLLVYKYLLYSFTRKFRYMAIHKECTIH